MISDGTYRIYNVVSDGASLHYNLGARFRVQGGVFVPIQDPYGILARYVDIGRLDERSSRFLESFMRGSYRHTIIEIPGREYPESYSEPL